MRIASIDILRAITMTLMIWVNDFHTIIGVPKWLEHASSTEDYLGFSDIIFPLFLFLVGLSIPLAIQKRLTTGESRWSIALHIMIRSLSLLLIGVYMVNYETAHHDSLLIGKYGWCILMATAVGLIWMNWKRSPVAKKWYQWLQGVGIAILIFLAVIYKGGATGDEWLSPQWWGILGLIGWAYLANAIFFVLFRGNLSAAISIYLFFVMLSVFKHSDLLPTLPSYLKYISTWYSGTIPAFTSLGVVATLLYNRLSKKDVKWILLLFVSLGIVHLFFGLITRPIWGISKIQSTPSWLAICNAIGLILFSVVFYIADVRKVKHWSTFIMPAGTATLTCYMLPYIIYPVKVMAGIRLPAFLNMGVIGLLSSFVFALMVVWLTGFFERKGFKLKL